MSLICTKYKQVKTFADLNIGDEIYVYDDYNYRTISLKEISEGPLGLDYFFRGFDNVGKLCSSANVCFTPEESLDVEYVDRYGVIYSVRKLSKEEVNTILLTVFQNI